MAESSDAAREHDWTRSPERGAASSGLRIPIAALSAVHTGRARERPRCTHPEGLGCGRPRRSLGVPPSALVPRGHVPGSRRWHSTGELHRWPSDQHHRGLQPVWYTTGVDPIERVLPELYALTSFEQFPARALDVARRVVGGDKADFTEVNLLTGDFRVLVDPEPSELVALEPARVAYMSQHPALRHFFREDDGEPRLISDFLSASEFHRLPLYGEFFRLVGVEDQLTVTMSDRSIGRIAGISIDRDSRSFQESDRRLLTRLRPHLTIAYLNALAFSEAVATTASGPASMETALMSLSDRQLDVIALIASGCTNAQIGQLLGISAATVRKHVEGILGRLNLPNRTAAAALYLKKTETSHLECWTAAVDGMVAR